MHTLHDIREQLRAELPYLRNHNDVDRLGICGSYLRGEKTEESDLDLPVSFPDTPGLFGIVGLKQHLDDRLRLSIDLGMPDA